MSAETQTCQFEAETARLLDLVIHSLYTEKEIFLRELISNSSDALDRLRFESLTDSALLPPGHEFEIRLETGTSPRTLSVIDTGIGMSREDAVKNLGTIARSGTREAREKIQAAKSAEDAASLIGQFGVGFYSSFMVADRVVVVTRKAGEAGATRWESKGDGTFTLSEAERDSCGTTVTLFLRDADPEGGIDDFTQSWQLTNVVKRHSDFINYPIVLIEEAKEEGGTPERRVLNSMKPIWTRSRSEVTEQEYNEFYRHVTHDWHDALVNYSYKAEGVHEYQALVFVPSKASPDLYYASPDTGIRLYARRVLVIEKCQDLLPTYLRFVRGVVDASDLPLNISRQRLQHDRHITQIRKWLTRKVLDSLDSLRTSDSAKYLQMWREFGRAIKEGAGTDFDHKDRITSLLLFESTHSTSDMTSLKDYVSRMPEGQADIYYLTGGSRAALENSPHMEALREKGYEVLFMLDPVDEYMLQFLPEFEGKHLKSAAKGALDLDKKDADGKKEDPAKEAEEQEARDQFASLLTAVQGRLSDEVKEVRLSHRLVKSPACLVVEDYEMSPYMEKLLSQAKGEVPKRKRVMELNPKHPIVAAMRKRLESNASDPILDDSATVLLGMAQLAEGSELSDAPKFSEAMVRMTQRSLGE
jgi:molecular chaperone HtpG